MVTPYEVIGQETLEAVIDRFYSYVRLIPESTTFSQVTLQRLPANRSNFNTVFRRTCALYRRAWSSYAQNAPSSF